MKQIIPFSRYFLIASLFSLSLVIMSSIGYFSRGFNLGIDFQAGLLQEVQFAPTAFNMTYNGPGNASVIFSRTSLDIVVSGAAADEQTYRFPFSSYISQGELVRGLNTIEGFSATQPSAPQAGSATLIQSALSSALLESENPYTLFYLPPGSPPIRIEDVRAALQPLGQVAVQVLGIPEERHFMIRMEDSELGGGLGGAQAEMIMEALESNFGRGGVVITRSDYVGSRFARDLSNQALGLLGMTLIVILAYCSFRFKLQFAIGAVISLIHNGIITIGFIIWSGMEFNTITIAAIMTILGYTVNDTVVVFDRIKETRRIYPDDTFLDVLNRALSETLSRTIITTVSTMLAVACLYIFTTGGMKDFALALMVGMVVGVYSTIFIASSFVLFYDNRAKNRNEKKRQTTFVKA